MELTVTACPERWVEYRWKWDKVPPAGIIGLIEGQVVLKRGQSETRALSKIRILSDGRVYAPTTNGGIPAHRPEKYELDGVSDYDFSGEIMERVA
jgi:hypothetical protein